MNIGRESTWEGPYVKKKRAYRKLSKIIRKNENMDNHFHPFIIYAVTASSFNGVFLN